MADGQVGYSPGHFATSPATNRPLPFNNVTIELLKPQGEPRNLCEKIIDAPSMSAKIQALTIFLQTHRLECSREQWCGNDCFETGGILVTSSRGI